MRADAYTHGMMITNARWVRNLQPYQWVTPGRRGGNSSWPGALALFWVWLCVWRGAHRTTHVTQ